MDKNMIDNMLIAQCHEITAYHMYKKLALKLKDEHNKAVLIQIADNEKEHYNYLKQYTKQDIKPSHFRIFFYFWMARIFGFTFTIKLMEKGEESAQKEYLQFSHKIPEIQKIIDDEERHENELIGMMDEKKLNYVGSIVLGLNDALVELTGALAGLSFALQDTHIVAVAGLITGIAASFSMAASEYLSHKSEGNVESALTSAIYTGIAYIITVTLLILPYLILSNYIICLFFTILTAVLIIFLFNYYISVAKDFDFKRRFFEMLVISLGVAAISFGIGFIIRNTLGIEI